MSYGHYPQQQYQRNQGYGSGGGGYTAPQQHHDPYRAWYAARLAELTFNSRPIIQNLSIQAVRQRDEGNWTAMQAISEEIEQAVLRAPPQGKLPLLYLIDSISKNAGAPYTDQLFPVFLAKLYLKTYREVDGVTKSKMEEMLKLWRTGGPYGAELYPSQVREEVERQIIGSASVLTQPQVQANLRAFLKEKEAEMANEFTTQRAKTVNVLVQIDQLLSSSQVSQKELADISDKVHAMKAGVEPKSAQLNRLPGGQQPAPAPAAARPPAFVPRPAFPQQPPQPQPPQQQQQFGGWPAAPAAPAAPAPAAPTAIPAIPAMPFNVADILRNLNNSGVLSQPRTPEPSKPKGGLEGYEEMILALDVRVDFLDPNRLALPVEHLPVRCKQCGLRFPEGENKLQAHMDWHFRRNRKERETEGRGAHRRWLPRAEEWIDENVQGSGPAAASGSADDSNALPTKLSADMIASLKRKMVRAPSDPVKAKIPCPICKEQFKSEWNEDEEEWVFMNAVEAGTQIYHAVCRAEASLAAKKNRLLAKERAASASPAPSIADDSTKRKATSSAEPDDAKRVKTEPDAEPIETVPPVAVKTEPGLAAPPVPAPAPAPAVPALTLPALSGLEAAAAAAAALMRQLAAAAAAAPAPAAAEPIKIDEPAQAAEPTAAPEPAPTEAAAEDIVVKAEPPADA